MDLFSIDKKNEEASFQRIAKELLNNYVIMSNHVPYRITEIEFYINSADHGDDYTHSHPLQKTKGKWYMHGSGMDITCGSDDFYGGILIRAIYNLDNSIHEKDRYIYGPIKIVAELFKNLDSVLLHSFPFGLVKDESNLIKEKEEPIAAPRIGLNEKNNPDMHKKHYRFLVMPKKQHGEKTKIIEAMRQSGKYTEEQMNGV